MKATFALVTLQKREKISIIEHMVVCGAP